MSATESAHALTKLLTFNDEVLMVALSEMPDDVAKRRLRDEGPSITWAVGHMLHHRNRIAAAVRCSGPDVDVAPYAHAATDGRDYPSVEALQRTWREFSDRLVTAVNALSAADLAAPSPVRLPHGEQTLLDALRFTVWHETLHLGQVSMLRSHHGLTPLVTVILERASAA